MRSERKERRIASPLKTFFLGTALALFVVIAVVLGGMVASTTPADLLAGLTNPEIVFAIELSIVTGLISTALCLLIAVPAAYALARYEFRGKWLVSTVANLPLVLPPLVAGVALLMFFAINPLGKTLVAWGLAVVFTPLGIIVAQIFVNVPYLIRVLRSTFAGINPRYEYVARTLGCTEAGAFRQVTIPLARRGLIAGTVITWSKAMGEFGAVLMLAGATQMKTETLPIALYINMATGNINAAVAAATILMAIALVVLVIFERLEGGKGSPWC